MRIEASRENPRKIKIRQDPDDEVTTEILASSIREISEGIKKLRQGPINEKGLLILIHHACKSSYGSPKPTQAEIRKVLDGVENLEKTYLRKR